MEFRRYSDIISEENNHRRLLDETPPTLNLVFAIDLSASMADESKLDGLKSSFHLFLERIRPKAMFPLSFSMTWPPCFFLRDN